MWLYLVRGIVTNGLLVQLASMTAVVEIELATTLTDLNPKLLTDGLQASTAKLKFSSILIPIYFLI